MGIRIALLSMLISFLSAAQPWPFISGTGILNKQSRSYDVVNCPGGFLFAGWSGVPWLATDASLFKLGPSGDTIWIKHYGGNGADFAFDIAPSPDGYFVFAGSTSSFGEGADDVLLVKVDNNGDTLYTRCYGGPLPERARAVVAVQGAQPGYLLCGYTESYGAGMKDIYLMRTDLSGSLMWSKTYGGPLDEEGYDVTETPGGFAITGYTMSFGADSMDMFILKTDTAGNALWMKRIGNNYDDFGEGVMFTPDSQLMVAGHGKSGSMYNNAWLIKYDVSGGAAIWKKEYGGALYDAFYHVQGLSNGDMLAGGFTNCFGAGGQDVFIVRMDANGDTLWTRTFGGTGCEEVYGFTESPDSALILAAYEQSFSQMTQVSFLVRTDRNGNGPGCHEYGAAPSVQTLSVYDTIVVPLSTSGNGVEGRTKFGISRGDHLDRFCSPGGMEEKYETFLSVFPVPSHGMINLMFSSPTVGISELKVFTALGRLAHTIPVASGTSLFSADLGFLPGGVYLLRYTGHSFTGTARILIVE